MEIQIRNFTPSFTLCRETDTKAFFVGERGGEFAKRRSLCLPEYVSKSCMQSLKGSLHEHLTLFKFRPHNTYTPFCPVSVEVGSGKLRSSVKHTWPQLPAPNLYANGTKLGVQLLPG